MGGNSRDWLYGYDCTVAMSANCLLALLTLLCFRMTTATVKCYCGYYHYGLLLLQLLLHNANGATTTIIEDCHLGCNYYYCTTVKLLLLGYHGYRITAAYSIALWSVHAFGLQMLLLQR